jgi:PEP-CTERM motif
MKTTLLVGALATCALLNFAPSGSLANVLSPGDTGVAPDTFTLPPAFTILAIHTDAAVSSDPVDSALLDEFVISDQSNVFGAGDLDFIIVVENDGFHNLAGITASSFAGFKTDLGYLTDSTGVPPSTVDRPAAATVGFNFFDGVPRLSDTAQLVIETNATRFSSGSLKAGFSTGSATMTALTPSVPEPSTWAMLGIGFVGLGLLRTAWARTARPRAPETV